MAEKPTPKPTATKTPASRDERLKAALKANLARRKTQAKARVAGQEKTTQSED